MPTIEKESLIGKRVPKMDAPEKAAGRTRYVHDMNLPGQLIGKILRTDRIHAKILSMDTSAAEALPGVKAVITAKDMPAKMLGLNNDNPPLKGDKVRAERDEIAAVAAITEEIALEALKLIKVEYEDLPTLFDPRESEKEGAPHIQESKDSNVCMEFEYEHGDAAKAETEADFVIEDTFKLHYVTHACMGVSGVIADFDNITGNLTLHSNTQVPFLHKREFSEVLEMDPSRIRIIQPPIGGGFGSKLDIYPFEPIAVILAKKSRCPVKIVFTREEEFMASPTRQPAYINLRSGVKKDGTITSRVFDSLLDNGAYTSWGATIPFVMMQTASSFYRVTDCQYATKAVYTNNPTAGSFRGYGNLQATFAIEQHMDKMAEAVGMDPLEFRLKNAQEAGEVTGQGMHFKTCGFKECLSTAGEKSDFSRKFAENNANRGNGNPVKKGIGMASMLHVGGGAKIYPSDGCGTILKMDDFGHVTILTGASEIGQGSETVLSQLVCEELGVPLSAVTVVNNDTDITPWDVGVHASRTTFIGGNAAIGAAKLAKAKVLESASQVSNIPADQLDMRGGCIVRADDGEVIMQLGKLLRGMHFKDKAELVTTSFYYEPPSVHQDKGFKGDVSAAYAWATHVVEVEVDTETGIVTLDKVTAAHDVGRVLNEMSLEGQIEGGIIMGQGYALTEDLLVKEGRVITPNFRDYKMVTAPEIPEIDLSFIETQDGEGPQGAKGVGEAPSICMAAAVGNAIYNATGVRIYEAPYTPEKVYRALKGAVEAPSMAAE
ncbi:MAG: molybdopterin-dependent oxidoreductase [Rhodospirillales bacterium]|nr:molybdopterin-dependent oxidoreductase [Rhodospirillales bacterium]